MANHKTQSNKSDNPKLPGIDTRNAATLLVTLVTDDNANLGDLTNPNSAPLLYQQLDDRDQELAKAITYTALRNYRRIGIILSKLWDRKPPQKARFLIHSLEVAAAQIMFMDVPDSAAVNLAVSAIGNDKRTSRFSGFANAILRKLVRDKEVLSIQTKDEHPFSSWMYKTLVKDFGKEKTKLIGRAINKPPTLDLQLKSGSDLFEVDKIILPRNTVRITSNKPVTELSGFTEGNWWVQDFAASQPVQLFGNVQNKKIADLCAAPGGKTLQLAANGAQVTAVDISSKRIKRIKQNLDRTGLSAQIIEADIEDWYPEEKFDGVLLDAPCSATGTMRRHPDILWNKTPQNIETLISLQRKLIDKAANFVKPGGILVYANCSLLKDEGENLITNLGSSNLTLSPIKKEELPGLEECITGLGIFRSLNHYQPDSLTPVGEDQSGMDGFFAARFIVN